MSVTNVLSLTFHQAGLIARFILKITLTSIDSEKFLTSQFGTTFRLLFSMLFQAKIHVNVICDD